MARATQVEHQASRCSSLKQVRKGRLSEEGGTPGTVLSQEAEQEGWGQGSRETWVHGV